MVPVGVVAESPDEVLTTMKKDGQRRWMHPTTSPGRWLNLRRVVGYLLIAIFMALPIVHVGGKPSVFINFLEREFTFFGLTLYATDTILLMVVGIMLLLGVVFVTAVLGRAWCGWGCPQTVYMELVFRPIETLFEGPASRRRKRDGKRDDGFGAFWLKGLKWLVFAIISLVLAHTFVAYFVSWESLIAWMTGPPTEHWGFFLMMAIVTALILFDFGWFREQMCTLACPYARIQSVLLDRDSLIVSYDPGRGEPRGRRARKPLKTDKLQVSLELGDCIDCGVCVRTCPTGIDIREGLQMECISCTQCIDGCDEVMDKVGKPRGLIRFSSINGIDKGETHIMRPRVIIYATLLVALMSVFTWMIVDRSPIDAEVVRPNNGAPFMKLPDGKVANRLRFRVQNRTPERALFSIVVEEPKGSELKFIGNSDLTLEQGEERHVDAWIVSDPGVFEGGNAQASFRFSGGEGVEISRPFVLLGPAQ